MVSAKCDTELVFLNWVELQRIHTESNELLCCRFMVL